MSLLMRRIVLAVLCLVLVAVVITVSTRKGASSEASGSSTTTTTIVEARQGQECEGGYAVKLFGNSNKKLDDAHEARIQRLRAKYQGAVLDVQVRDMHLRMAKRDPRFLFLMTQSSSSLRSSTGVKSVEELSKDGCYTAKGREAYTVLKGALYASTVDPNAEAGANWVNTGVGSDGNVFQTGPGISGNRHGTLYRLPNGEILVIMDRCGNITTPGPIPNVPPETTVPTNGGTIPPGTNPPGTGTRPPHTTQPPRTTAPPHTSPPTTRPCTDIDHNGKCDTHVVSRPLPGGAGGPQAPDSDSTPDTQDPDGTHHGSDPGTGCHGTCTGGTPTTTRPAPPSTVQPTPTTVPATAVPTTAPPP